MQIEEEEEAADFISFFCSNAINFYFLDEGGVVRSHNSTIQLAFLIFPRVHLILDHTSELI